MKKVLLLIIIVISGSGFLVAQDRSRNGYKTAPLQNVQQSFHNDHPDAGNVNWSRQNHQWHASHMDSKNKMPVDTYYDERGQHIVTHRQLDKGEFPQEIDQNVRSRYHSDGNYYATRIERPNQGLIFRLSIRQRNRNKTVYMDDRGNEVRYNDHH